jgi:hypothetical protein
MVMGAGFASADPVPGDINGDGVVNFSDFVILARNYGKTGDPSGPGTVFVTVYDTITVDRVSFSQNIVLTAADGDLLDTLIVRTLPIRTSGIRAEASEILTLDVSGITALGGGGTSREVVYRGNLLGYRFAIPPGWVLGEASTVLSNREVEELAIVVGISPLASFVISDSDVAAIESELSFFLEGYRRESSGITELGGEAAREVTWTASPGGFPLKGVFVFAAGGGYLYMATFTSLDDASYSRFVGDFTSLVSSFQAGAVPAAKVPATAFSRSPKEMARSISRQLLRTFESAGVK